MKKSAMMAFLTLMLLGGAASMLSACNTMSGFGRDLNAAGHALNQSAEEEKTY
jgi:predicted small secreted protein